MEGVMSTGCIVDEEYYFANNVASICRIAGFDVVIFSDATGAFDHFSSLSTIPTDARLLIDCALAPGGIGTYFRRKKQTTT
jgi:hypothetical protein